MTSMCLRTRQRFFSLEDVIRFFYQLKNILVFIDWQKITIHWLVIQSLLRRQQALRCRVNISQLWHTHFDATRLNDAWRIVSGRTNDTHTRSLSFFFFTLSMLFELSAMSDTDDSRARGRFTFNLWNRLIAYIWCCSRNSQLHVTISAMISMTFIYHCELSILEIAVSRSQVWLNLVRYAIEKRIQDRTARWMFARPSA